MARMHARRKGKSSSKRPLVSESPGWVPLKPKEIEKMVVELYNQGNPPAKIGLRLRDQFAVPNVRLATGKAVTTILKENGIKPKLPEDLSNLMQRAVSLSGHLKANPRDSHNMRGLQLIESKIRRLTKYYKSKGVLPEDWNYTPDMAELEVK